MKRGDVIVLAQLIVSMKEKIVDFEKSFNDKNVDSFQKTKKQLLELSERIDSLI